jgi:hypothetical protein
LLSKERYLGMLGVMMFKGSDCRKLCLFVLVTAGQLRAVEFEPLKLDPQNPHYLTRRSRNQTAEVMMPEWASIY